MYRKVTDPSAVNETRKKRDTGEGLAASGEHTDTGGKETLRSTEAEPSIMPIDPFRE